MKESTPRRIRPAKERIANAKPSVRIPNLSEEERQGVNARILDTMRKGLCLGGKPLSREEIYDRCERRIGDVGGSTAAPEASVP